jgi:hypothetical protein
MSASRNGVNWQVETLLKAVYTGRLALISMPHVDKSFKFFISFMNCFKETGS